MSSQIVLITETLAVPDVKGMCFNVTEWSLLQQSFSNVAFQLGCIMLVVGFVIGAVAVFGYYRMKDNGSSE